LNSGLLAWLANNRYGDTPQWVYSSLSFSLRLGEGFLWSLGDVGSILTPGHLESTACSWELFSKVQAFLHDRTLCTPGLCITQGRQGILMPGRRETCGAYISLSRVSSSLGVSPHIIPLHFSLSVSRSLRLFLSLSLSQSLSLSLCLSLSLHFSAGTLWVSLSITPWFTPNSALRSQFLLLFGHLRLHEWNRRLCTLALTV